MDNITLDFTCPDQVGQGTPNVSCTDRRMERWIKAANMQEPGGTRCLLGRAADDVVGEDVVAAPHGEPDAVPVALERVVRHISPEGLEHRHPSVAVVVDVVALVRERYLVLSSKVLRS